jgi:hypothetical protein
MHVLDNLRSHTWPEGFAFVACIEGGDALVRLDQDTAMKVWQSLFDAACAGRIKSMVEEHEALNAMAEKPNRLN